MSWLAADLGGIFIVLNRDQRDRTLKNRQGSSEEAMRQASLFTFGHALKMFTQDKVMTRSRLTEDKNQTR